MYIQNIAAEDRTNVILSYVKTIKCTYSKLEQETSFTSHRFGHTKCKFDAVYCPNCKTPTLPQFHIMK